MRSIFMWFSKKCCTRSTGESAWENNKTINNFVSLANREYENSSFPICEEGEISLHLKQYIKMQVTYNTKMAVNVFTA